MGERSYMTHSIHNLLRFAAIITSGVIVYAGAVFIEMKITADSLNTDIKTSSEYFEELTKVYIDGESYVPQTDVDTLLIIGVDKYETEETEYYLNHEQADFAALAVIHNDKKEWKIIQFNRDTMMNVHVLDVYGNNAGTEEMQLALSHTYGSGKYDSCLNTAKAISDFLYGIEIDSCMQLSMNAVPIINDHFGGVTVKIKDDMTSVDKAFKKNRTVTLKGDQVLSFVRARQGLEDSSNTARMERQKQYLSALAEVMQHSSVDSTLLTEIEPYTVGNIDAGMITSYWDIFREYSFKGIISPKGEAVKGETYMEFYADEDDVKNIVKTEFYMPAQRR